MRFTPNLERTISSVFSLTSITTAIMVNKKIAKKKVVKNFFNMYQSIFFMAISKDNGLRVCAAKKPC